MPRLNDQIIPLVPDDIYAPFDDENPYALTNLVPERVKEAIVNLDLKWFKFSESQLRYRCKPTAEICRVRLAFWDEYIRAIDQHRAMSIESILKGFCAKRIFYEDWLHDEKIVAYLICPPANYEFAMREMLDLGWSKLREVMDEPIKEKQIVKVKGQPLLGDDGQPITVEVINYKTVDKIVEMVKMLELRVKGAVAQRMLIDQRNLNVNMNADQAASSFGAPESMEQLEAMSQKIEAMKQSIMDVELLTSAKEDTAHIISRHEASEGVIIESSEASPPEANASESGKKA